MAPLVLSMPSHCEVERAEVERAATEMVQAAAQAAGYLVFRVIELSSTYELNAAGQVTFGGKLVVRTCTRLVHEVWMSCKIIETPDGWTQASCRFDGATKLFEAHCSLIYPGHVTVKVA
ncbi:MAG TPA: hypothetical protein VD907_01025 [Verrucomicrobiae bacterium]|nr:hypothetical protein [Verrucomicrobiae bacterium]